MWICLKTFQKVVCFYLDVFVLAVIRHLTAATAAATPSILFTEMFVNVLRSLQ